MRSRLLPYGPRAPFRTVGRSWVCASCRFRSLPQRALTTSPAAASLADKPYYVTTPIFYVNADAHVGHLYSMVLTDVLKRWQALRGRKALLCTGTDEHGMKIQQAAAKAGLEPKLFCDKGAENFMTLAARANISYDTFLRTTDPKHREAVEYAWFLLRERGYIFTSKHAGWYSVSDEAFYPNSAVQLIVEPQTGRKIMSSIETGKEVEWTEEVNYHFRLSAFRDRLLRFYAENPRWINDPNRMQTVVQAVQSGLEDLSISRPSTRLTWGIPVPDDDSQTIYVWLDALINYITKAGYPWSPDKQHEGGWPADVHVIGKDILRFHCIYWPAFLMALGLPLPKRILTHAHWTLGKLKMSKSVGNVVNPFFALDRFGVDAMRFYLAHDGGIAQDADYSNEHIIKRYKTVLQGGLGGLTSRVMRAKKWSVPEAIKTWKEATPTAESIGELSWDHMQRLRSLARGVAERMEELEVRAAIQAITHMILRTNYYISVFEPWKSPDPKPCVFLCAETLRILGILLQPFMPDKARDLLDMLGVDESRRSFEWAEFDADDSFGVPRVALGNGIAGALFPPLTSEM